jgi:ferredoxin-NADP reductase/nitrite reductase/ring-hydroxylating ferredoxin subunit/(2Fe-2S) ferredoxin
MMPGLFGLRILSGAFNMDKNRYCLCKVSELAPGGSAVYELAGYKVALYNVDGIFFATQDHCQHKGGSLGRGSLTGSVVECPLHGWEFDVSSGECLTQTHCKPLRLFPTSVEGDMVWIEDLDEAIGKEAVVKKVSIESAIEATTSFDSNQHYELHVFCCINERELGHPRGSCSARGATDLQSYMKVRGKELGFGSRFRINKSGCLDRCELGPVMVIYPAGIWYSYNSRKDIDEILESHLVNGQVVDRLLLKPGQTKPLKPEAPRLGLRVSGKTAYGGDLCRYELVSSNFELLPEYEPGAHIDLTIGGGLGFRRSYSLMGDHKDRARYIIGIRREEPSRGGSDWLLDNLEAGGSLESSPPSNNFPLVEQASSFTLIAGGIGITPFLSMGHELNQREASYHLHYCVRNEESAPFLDEVKALFGDRMTLYVDGGDPARGIDLASVLQVPEEGQHVYVCGPPGIVAGVRNATTHWSEELIHWEQFSTELDDENDNNEVFEVLLSRQDLMLQVGKNKTILEVVRSAGVNVESSCEDGLCGSCRTRLLGGCAEHRDLILSDSDKADNNEIMICVSRANAGETLVLDL